MSRLNSSRRIQIDTSEPRYDGGGDDDESNDGSGSLKFQPSNSNVTEDLEPFMGVKVRRKASRLRDYQGDYIDVQSRPHLMKILEKQGLIPPKILWISELIVSWVFGFDVNFYYTCLVSEIEHFEFSIISTICKGIILGIF